MIIEALTDKRTRTAPQLRKILNDAGGSLGMTGSVAFMFEQKGVLTFLAKENEKSLEQIVEAAIDCGAEDVEEDSEEEEVQIICDRGDVTSLRSSLSKSLCSQYANNTRDMTSVSSASVGERGCIVSTAEVPYVAQEQYLIQIDDEKNRSRLETMLDQLDELEDVQNVYHNAILS